MHRLTCTVQAGRAGVATARTVEAKRSWASSLLIRALPSRAILGQPASGSHVLRCVVMLSTRRRHRRLAFVCFSPSHWLRPCTRNQSHQGRKRKYTQLRRASTFVPAGWRCLSAHGHTRHPFTNLKHASNPPALLLLQSSPVCHFYNCCLIPVFLHRSRFTSRPYSLVCSPRPTPPIITSVASRSQPCH